jgi:hypothetical protein
LNWAQTDYPGVTDNDYAKVLGKGGIIQMARTYTHHPGIVQQICKAAKIARGISQHPNECGFGGVPCGSDPSACHFPAPLIPDPDIYKRAPGGPAFGQLNWGQIEDNCGGFACLDKKVLHKIPIHPYHHSALVIFGAAVFNLDFQPVPSKPVQGSWAAKV